MWLCGSSTVFFSFPRAGVGTHYRRASVEAIKGRYAAPTNINVFHGRGEPACSPASLNGMVRPATNLNVFAVSHSSEPCRVGKVLFLPTFLIKKVVGNHVAHPT
ncbi:MAG: hypothetical protein KAI83_07765 [Thiomargarita sp.]|nr:hypothetical protein [Thiomargarita sp.]